MKPAPTPLFATDQRAFTVKTGLIAGRIPREIKRKG